MSSPLYASSLALLTDLYQLTMAQAYHHTGRHEHEAVFHLFFRTLPFGGGYAVCAGLDPAIDFLQGLRFSAEDVAYLATLRGSDKEPLFRQGFLSYLEGLRFTCDVDAVPEGTTVFPHEPLLRVQGPILQCQLVETALLNILNFQTLVATKSARVCESAAGAPVLEFGLRRAQGIDGSLAASRAAHVGGAHATSNVLAGRLYGIPVKGTHAHSWVMSFDEELEAFRQYADAMPNNCTFLVDTYDTVSGVKNAIRVGEELRAKGHALQGVRLDSGDLAVLSQKARALLDEAGFPQAAVVASNDLDERTIESLRQQGARIDVWGVGTKLATAFDQPALGGVYKLAALREPGGPWRYRIKLSEQPIKVSIPGVQQVRRFTRDGVPAGDMLYDLELGVASPPTQNDLADPTLQYTWSEAEAHEDLLVPVLRKGECVYARPALSLVREHAVRCREALPATMRRLLNPQRYRVGLERQLARAKSDLIVAARAREAASGT